MVDHDELLRILAYDPCTGVFVWKIHAGRSAKPGCLAGSPNDCGYLFITYKRIKYRAHRLAWFYMTGDWPSQIIDHRDLNRGNNSFLNLRIANIVQNNCNRLALASNKLGVKGVSVDPRRGAKPFRACISIADKTKHLGYFATVEHAADAYAKAAYDLHGEFARC